jgi:DNA-binding IclR family transcriptional regulator
MKFSPGSSASQQHDAARAASSRWKSASACCRRWHLARPLMLRDLAAAAGMSAAKAHRYLVSFQRLELVVQDAATTRYDLGPAALKLGLASLERLDSVKLARQRVHGLMERTGQTLALAVWGNQGPTAGALGRVAAPPSRSTCGWAT